MNVLLAAWLVGAFLIVLLAWMGRKLLGTSLTRLPPLQTGKKKKRPHGQSG